MFKINRKILFIIFMMLFSSSANAKYEKVFYDFSIKSINGEMINLSKYKNNVILLVNVASYCGFTNQYSDLQKLWDENKNKNFILIGIPSDDFGNQEFKKNNEIKNFCETNFFIDFFLTTKTKIKGDNAHPFFLWAKKLRSRF